MVRLVYQPRKRWAFWTASILSVFVLLGLWADSRAAGRLHWPFQIYTCFLFTQLARLAQGPLYILTDRALLIMGAWPGQRKAIPLAVAEVRTSGKRWVIRWHDGRLPCREELKLPAEVGATLEQVAAVARELPPGGPAVAAGDGAGMPKRWLLATLYGGLVLCVLAIWLNQPLVLAPLLGAFLLRAARETRFVLAGEELLHLSGDRIVACTPLAALSAIQDNRLVTTLVSSAPGQPPIRVSTAYATELIQAIRAHLGRDAASSRDVTEVATPVTEPAPAATMDRCALCGQPMGAGVSGDVLICQRCSDRVRYEAVQAGYGLQGKESKPL